MNMRIDPTRGSSQADPVSRENSTMALCDLMALLNKMMRESALTQGDVADDLSKGIDQTSTLLKQYNTIASDIMSKIQSLSDSMKSLQPYLIAFAVAGVACGGAGVVAAVGTEATIASAASSMVAIGGGATSCTEGAFNLQLGGKTADLAYQNGAISAITGAQQGYQASTKWATDQLGATFTNMSDLTKSGAAGIMSVYNGISAAGNDMLRGVRGQKI